MDQVGWDTELKDSRGRDPLRRQLRILPQRRRTAAAPAPRRRPSRMLDTLASWGRDCASNLGGDPAFTFALITGTAVYLGPDAYVRVPSDRRRQRAHQRPLQAR